MVDFKFLGFNTYDIPTFKQRMLRRSGVRQRFLGATTPTKDGYVVFHRLESTMILSSQKGSAVVHCFTSEDECDKAVKHLQDKVIGYKFSTRNVKSMHQRRSEEARVAFSEPVAMRKSWLSFNYDDFLK